VTRLAKIWHLGIFAILASDFGYVFDKFEIILKSKINSISKAAKMLGMPNVIFVKLL
jgi:hypothetical protein